MTNKIKCILCEKKFSKLMKHIHTCRCNAVCCSQHMHNHNCDFDYKKLFNEQSRNLVLVNGTKIEKL